MPLLTGTRTWAKKQSDIERRNGFEDSPDTGYLLGFDVEHLEPLRPKTYIRRLWLAFESGKKPNPKRFFDPQAERFSKEINDWVSVLANDPCRLAAELQVEPGYGVDGVSPGSRFLVDIVQSLLVTRKWGEALWGRKKASEEDHRAAIGACKTGKRAEMRTGEAPATQHSRKRKRGEDRHLELLANPKPEEEHGGHPRWPQDEKRITLATRHWMASLLQARTQSLRDKTVPRVKCPEDPDERRKLLAATWLESVHERSPDPVVEPYEGDDTPETRLAFGVKQEDPPSPISIRHIRTRETTKSPVPSLHEAHDQSISRPTAQSVRSFNTQATPPEDQTARLVTIEPALTVAQESNAIVQTSAKRRRRWRVSSKKRVSTSSRHHSRQLSSTRSLRLFGEDDPVSKDETALPSNTENKLPYSSDSRQSTARQSPQAKIATTYRTPPSSVALNQSERSPAGAEFPPEAFFPEESAVDAHHETSEDENIGLVRMTLNSEVNIRETADLGAGSVIPTLVRTRFRLTPLPLHVDHADFQLPLVVTRDRTSASRGSSLSVQTPTQLDFALLSDAIAGHSPSYGGRETSVPAIGQVLECLATASSEQGSSEDDHVSALPNPSQIAPRQTSRPALPAFYTDNAPNPPQCAKCVHSLNKDIDGYKPDRVGRVQFRKTCVFCRNVAGPRPLPCSCNACRCPPPAAERNQAETIPANGIPPAGHCLNLSQAVSCADQRLFQHVLKTQIQNDLRGMT